MWPNWGTYNMADVIGLTREELRKAPCRGCWWQEGGRCYSKQLGFNDSMKNPDNPIFAQGILITPAHLAWCNDAADMGWFAPVGKRAMLEQFIPAEILVITSEGTV